MSADVGDDLDEARRRDVALLEAHVNGDTTAFGELFDRHRDRLWAVALRTTGNPEDAADALQDAMISAFRRAGSFRGDSAVTTWLHRIVVNACLDRLRRAKVRAADPLPDDLEEQAARGRVAAGGGPGASLVGHLDGSLDGEPEARALAGDLRRRVLAGLEELPPDQKAALVLVDMEGYPVLEASAILEVPVGTIKSRCARGRARLAVLLAELDPRKEDLGLPGTAGGGTSAPRGASHSGDPPVPAPDGTHTRDDGDSGDDGRDDDRPDRHENPHEEVSGRE